MLDTKNKVYGLNEKKKIIDNSLRWTFAYTKSKLPETSKLLRILFISVQWEWGHKLIKWEDCRQRGSNGLKNLSTHQAFCPQKNLPYLHPSYLSRTPILFKWFKEYGRVTPQTKWNILQDMIYRILKFYYSSKNHFTYLNKWRKFLYKK